MTSEGAALIKRPTGIEDLDAVTRGGLPARGATLVMGEAGAGKTVLGLQILANAVEAGEGGVYMSFEESRDGIARGAASFQWGPGLMASERVRVIDARPPTSVSVSGGFDIEGLAHMIEAQAREVGANWVVLDGIDRLLSLQPDGPAALAEIERLQQWCESAELSLIFTGKASDARRNNDYFQGIEYLLDTVLVLSSRLAHNRLNRRFRIAKYRGTAHVTHELAMVMDDRGLHLGYDTSAIEGNAPVSSRRIGTGIRRLDEVLGGGVYAGSTILISGLPGTSKTTLAASFAAAAAERGERVLYMSFDEFPDRIVRNVASVGIELASHWDSGRLLIHSRQAWSAQIEEHYVHLVHLLRDLEPDMLVIDPISALLKATSEENAMETNERLLQMSRARGITTVLTSLNETDTGEGEATLSQASTLADTWISLSYYVRGGERNRALSIVKSRGTAHSNQVRELILSSDGVDLADVYQFGTEVLMGTARVHKEMEASRAEQAERAERERRQRDLARQIEQAESRIREANSELQRLQDQLALEEEANTRADEEAATQRADIRARRTPGGPRERRSGYERRSGNERDEEERQ
jgi:circadian clock protein KaiC